MSVNVFINLKSNEQRKKSKDNVPKIVGLACKIKAKCVRYFEDNF